MGNLFRAAILSSIIESVESIIWNGMDTHSYYTYVHTFPYACCLKINCRMHIIVRYYPYTDSCLQLLCTFSFCHPYLLSQLLFMHVPYV